MKLLGFLFGAILLLVPSLVEAQTPVVVSLQNAILSWDYTQGTSPATEFQMKCGGSATTLNRITTIPDSAARSIPVRSAIGGSGVWFCQVTASNKYGESASSNTVNFDAGDSPSSSPVNLILR